MSRKGAQRSQSIRSAAGLTFRFGKVNNHLVNRFPDTPAGRFLTALLIKTQTFQALFARSEERMLQKGDKTFNLINIYQ
jgi:hypothetical protein